MAEIDGNLYFYKIPTNEILGNRKEFYRLKKEFDETIQGWLGRFQSKIHCCEFPEIVSSEFYLMDKFMCELNAEEIESIRSDGDIWSFEKLEEYFVFREIDADQLNDDNSTVTSIDIKCEFDDFDEYPHNDNDMNEEDYLDGIKSKAATDDMDPLSIYLPIDVANGNTNTGTEGSDSNAIDEMLIEGMQCETVTRLDSLNEHKKSVHEALRPFSCDLCKKSFPRSNCLSKHKKSVHEGIRHNCSICGKSFTFLSNLNEHKRSVHEGIRHTCSICEKSFAHLSGLTRHKKTH